METNDPNWVQYVTAVLVVICLLGGFLYVPGAVGDRVGTAVSAAVAAEIAKMPADGATVDEIKEAIGITDSTKLDRVCELTEGCEYWEGNVGDLIALDEDEAWDDFEDALADLVGIDDDYLDIGDYEMKDYQVRAYSDNDRDDENWEVKVFIRQEYEDTDENENEVIYLLITSVLDEGDYDSLTVAEVSRNFEF